MKIHELKIEHEYYQAIIKGIKNFEVRKNDRDYQENDLLKLQLYFPDDKHYEPTWIIAKVTYVFKSSDYLLYDYVILGIKVLDIIG